MEKVLILCPTYDHADALFASIASVQGQSHENWELAVICDGSPERTHKILDEISAHDDRIKIYSHPKSQRTGEEYRDPIICETNAKYIMHLSDDDIWWKNHIQEILKLLKHAEWVGQAPLLMATDKLLRWEFANFGTPQMRACLRKPAPIGIGINSVAYTKNAYLKLPEGWSSTPRGKSTDAYMWKKFHTLPDLHVASSGLPSVLKLPSSSARKDWCPEQRLSEIIPWLAKSADIDCISALRRKASVFERFALLFAIHGSGTSVEDAIEKSGLVITKDTDSFYNEDALAGHDGVAVPLTASQRFEAEHAWLYHQAFFEGNEDAYNKFSDGEFLKLKRLYPLTVRIANSLSSIDDALKIYARMIREYPKERSIYTAAVKIAGMQTSSPHFQYILSEFRQRWPDYPLIQKYKD